MLSVTLTSGSGSWLRGDQWCQVSGACAKGGRTVAFVQPVLAVLCASATFASSCSLAAPVEPRDGPQVAVVVTGAATYATGDSVEVAIFNVSTRPIGYNTCPVALDSKRGTRWRQVARGSTGTWQDDFACNLWLLFLGPAEHRRLRIALPRGAGGGVYRLRFEHIDDGVHGNLLPLAQRVSNSFVIR